MILDDLVTYKLISCTITEAGGYSGLVKTSLCLGFESSEGHKVALVIKADNESLGQGFSDFPKLDTQIISYDSGRLKEEQSGAIKDPETVRQELIQWLRKGGND